MSNPSFNLDAAIQRAVKDLELVNEVPVRQITKPLPPDFAFVGDAERLAKALVEAAEEKLKQAKEVAAIILSEMKTANESLLDLGQRIDASRNAFHCEKSDPAASSASPS